MIPASSVESIASESRLSWWQQLPIKVMIYGKRIISPKLLPNDNKVQFIVRGIFKAIGYLFLLIATIPTAPLFLLGYLVVLLCAPPKQYIVGNGKIALSPEELLRHLKAIEVQQREISTLTIVQNDSAEPQLLTPEVCNLINKVMPKKIIVKHLSIDDSSLALLATDQRYYVVDTKKRCSKGVTELLLKDKINKYILPNTVEGTLQKLKKLADRKVRITALYFTCTLPTDYDKTVGDLLERLGPPVIKCRVYSDRSASQLKSALNGVPNS